MEKNARFGQTACKIHYYIIYALGWYMKSSESIKTVPKSFHSRNSPPG